MSVVMPCLDAGRMLRRALASVVRQTYANLEIVFVDNGSTDASDRLAQEIGAASGREFRFAACPERGVNRARALGFTLARGDYIQWMDADDEMNPDKVSLQVAALERERAFDIAFCDWVTRRFDAGDPPIDVPHRLAPVHDQLLRMLSGVWYPPHVYLLRRAAAQRLHQEKAWWPERRIATDVEYFAFAALLGYRFLHVPGAQVLYNVGGHTRQISAVTPYAVRVISLRDIYARLGAVGEMPGIKPRVTSRHRALLKQNWDLWRLPPTSVDITKLNAREFRLVHRVTGKTLKLRPREAAMVEALRGISAPQALAHLAPHIIAAIGATPGERATIIETLERLRHAGILTRTTSLERVALASDESAPVADAAPSNGAAGETRVMEGPLVSVVIPCLNAGRMLPRALNSVIGQTHRNLEIIVVDNGSTDGSDRLAQEIGGASGREFHFALCPERGANRARNRGYDLARGDYVQWLDADDELHREKIARQVDALERDRAYDIAYGDWTQCVIHSDTRPTVLVRKALEQFDDQILRILVGVWCPPHAYLLRRTVADQLDREQAWWPDRIYCHDREYFAFAALLGFRFLHVPGAHVYYNKWSSTQVSSATPYLDRVADLRGAFARFRELAERPTTKPRITAAHWLFLQQNWDLWILPRGSVDVAPIGNGSIRLRQIKTGRELVLSAKEAAIVETLQLVDEGRAFSHLVIGIADNAPELGNDYPGIMTALDRLRDAGILVLATSIDHVAPANDQIAPAAEVALSGSAAGETRVLEGPLVSVVTPCLNAGRMLPRALNSAIGQTYRNLEIIVVDNGSTDGSDRLAQEIGEASGRKFRFARWPERGANRARNQGYSMVRGDYVQWLDADDEIDRDKITQQVDALERDRGYDIAYCSWTQRMIYGVSGPTVIIPKPLEQVEDQILRALVGIWYPPHSYLFRRAAADQLDRELAWWPDRPNATDWEYVGFAALLGFRFLHVPSAHVFYNKWSGTQISNVTRYPEWVSASRAIFARFRELAERPTTKPLITAAHRLFLEQNWDLWRLPRGSVDVVAVGSQSIRLRHLGRGQQLMISAKEAKIIEVLQAVDLPRTLSYLVRAIADTTPELEDDYVAIMAVLERLRAEDVLDRSTLPAVPADPRRPGHASPHQLGAES